MDSKSQFYKLRKRLAKAIAVEVALGYGHKSYEGTWEISYGFPDYFDDPLAESDPIDVTIQLHCYLVGPGRHYKWSGSNFDEAFQKCKADVEKWLAGWEGSVEGLT